MRKPVFIMIFLILVTLPAALTGQAVNLKCLEVLPGGDVQVSWQPLQLGASFSNYTIYSSLNRMGPYTEAGVVNIITADNFLHTGAAAHLDTVHYYLVTNQGPGQSTFTDTLSTMLLTGSTVDFESISLQWSPLHSPVPFLPEMHPWYLIYREFPAGSWLLTDSTQNLLHDHHFWECNSANDSVRFRIGVRNDVFGCVSLSNQVSFILKNLSNRYPPVIDSVSIDADGNAVIGWQPGTEPDIRGYKIFLVTSSNDSIDYVDGRFSTSYSDQQSDPCDGPVKYILLSIDSCGNESPFPFDPSPPYPDKPHSTIYLQDIQYDPCNMTNRLQWNEYENFTPPLAITRIYISTAGGPFLELASVLPGQTSFVHAGLEPNTEYAYFVRAFSGDMAKTSSSCIKQSRSYNSPYPLFMYLRYVTVGPGGQVEVLFYTDTNAHVQSYRILRSDSPGGPFVEAGTVEDVGEDMPGFTDPLADANKGSYFYQVEVIDSCGVASIIANMARTIFLRVEALPVLVNRLEWNAYESWPGGVAGYRIYRRLDQLTLEQIGEAGPGQLIYDDNVSAFTGNYSRISYVVVAYEGAGNAYGFQDESYSNEAVAEQEPRVFIPNVIMPNGANNVLKPVTVFVGAEGYEFMVYNRWGEQVFYTTEPGLGWDGRYKGKLVPQDVYVYLIRFLDALGQPRQVKGNVVVIY